MPASQYVQRKSFDPYPPMAFDAAQTPMDWWLKARRLERFYGARLRSVAKIIGDMVKDGLHAGGEGAEALEDALARYSEVLKPWAKSVGLRMITEINAADKRAWMANASQMGEGIRFLVEKAPVGNVMNQLLTDQVGLITSLPTDAAQRVHELTLKGLSEGSRGGPVLDDILRTGEVTRARATTIARTETARTAAALTEARALHVGSTHYTWRTVGDADVRHDHRILNGKPFAWASPPVSDQRTGVRAHPGAIYNCRCIAIPQIPLEF